MKGMKYLAQRLLHYGLLIAVTMMAVLVMWWTSSRSQQTAHSRRAQHTSPLPLVAQPKALVSVSPIRADWVELTQTFTGKVRPWETYTLGFEVGGRIVALGKDENDQPLDDGMRVSAGQLLAQLDDRIFRARKSEATAQLEEAMSDLKRARRLRKKSPGAITDSEFQEHLTATALARAQHEIALKNLDDAVLAAPVEATLSRRMVNVGESVGMGQMAFELVQDEEMLVVVDVPESHIRELEIRNRAVGQKHDASPRKVHRAYVTLEGRNRFGDRLATMEGEVYRIAQVADPRTGLFEVEIRVPNHDRLLRAGMVATARIVTDRMRAYKVPESAVIFRGDEAFLFTMDNESSPLQAMFWEVGAIPIRRARRVTLTQWIDQGSSVMVPEEEAQLENIILRGQQRLADGQLVSSHESEDER